jgi:hypothetical protein
MSDGEQDWIGKAASSWVLLTRKPEALGGYDPLGKLRRGDVKVGDQTNLQNDRQVMAEMRLLCSMPALFPTVQPPPIGMAMAFQRLTVLGDTHEWEDQEGGWHTKATPGGYWYPVPPDPKVGVWTDDYATILRVFIPLRGDRSAD